MSMTANVSGGHEKKGLILSYHLPFSLTIVSCIVFCLY